MFDGLSPRQASAIRPYITVVLAMSADGKIADARRAAARFPSPTDKAHLEALIARADATLFGATTLRAYSTTLPISDLDLLAQRREQDQPEQPIQIVCSATGKLDPTWRFFSQSIPRWLVTTLEGIHTWHSYVDEWKSSFSQTAFYNRETDFSASLLKSSSEQSIRPRPRKHFEHTFITERPFNWHSLLKDLRTGTQALSTANSRLPIKRLLVMGGGELVASLLSEHLIDELHLTVCPLLIGGKTAPTPVGGLGFSLPNTPQLKLESAYTEGEEVFLHYTVRRP